MAEELPSLHIDTDWKKQAQEEKKRLAEQAAAKSAAPPATPPVAPGRPAAAASSPAAGRPGKARGGREMPAPGFATLVQSVLTQVFYYLGELGTASGQAGIDLDMAKHHLDTLVMLEDKTRNNLADDETKLLDTAMYEARSRFVSVATQFLGP